MRVRILLVLYINKNMYNVDIIPRNDKKKSSNDEK